MKIKSAYILLFFLYFFYAFFINSKESNLHAQKVGVVLSGGGSSGLAHIGVLKALEENNIPIDYITCTSIGAFVGAMYAIGYTPQQIEAIVHSPD